jgi:hypothetical protein
MNIPALYRAAAAARHGQDRRVAMPGAAELRDYLARHPGQRWVYPAHWGNCPLAYCLHESPGPDAWLVSTHTAFSQAFVERFDAELAKRRALSGADCLALLDDLERDAKT